MKQIIYLFFACALGMSSCSKDDEPEQRIPKQIIITQVALLNYPPTNNGQPWDDFSQYADPYFQISTLSASDPIYESQRIDDAPFSSPIVWNLYVPMNTTDGYTIFIYDYDSGSFDSKIAAAIINTWLPGDDFYESKIFTDKDNGATIRVEYEYIF